MAAYSGEKTGRSPKDKRIVKDETTENEIWWGDVNIACNQQTARLCESRAIDYISTRPKIFVVDGYAGWDPNHRIKVRVICVRAYHALFILSLQTKNWKETF
jgi:phosphoenolpyruvate carboxykinase (ATP)